MIVAPGLSTPRASASSIIATAGRSLTEPPGLTYSTLASTRHARVVDHAIQPHERGMTDGVEGVFVVRHPGLRGGVR